MFAFLPIVGPIIQGIVDIIKGRQNVDLKKDQDDVSVIEARQATLAIFRYDPGSLLCRDLIMFPVAVWCALTMWDTIIAESTYRTWMFHVAAIPNGPLNYLPYAVLAFLFGTAWRGR